jgi:hypothetical protein
MSIQTEFFCDGCGAEETKKHFQGAFGGAVSPPSGWASARSKNPASRAPILGFDLCPKCFDKVLKALPNLGTAVKETEG